MVDGRVSVNLTNEVFDVQHLKCAGRTGNWLRFTRQRSQAVGAVSVKSGIVLSKLSLDTKEAVVEKWFKKNKKKLSLYGSFYLNRKVSFAKRA